MKTQLKYSSSQETKWFVNLSKFLHTFLTIFIVYVKKHYQISSAKVKLKTNKVICALTYLLCTQDTVVAYRIFSLVLDLVYLEVRPKGA